MPKRTFLNKLHRKRLSQFFAAYDQYLFGVAANEKKARECAYEFGIAKTIEGHCLMRIARHYCKYWNQIKTHQLNPIAKRYVFDEKEWDRMTHLVRSLQKNFNKYTTLGFVYRQARFARILCNRQAIKEALKTCGHDLPEKPQVTPCSAQSSESISKS